MMRVGDRKQGINKCWPYNGFILYDIGNLVRDEVSIVQAYSYDIKNGQGRLRWLGLGPTTF